MDGRFTMLKISVIFLITGALLGSIPCSGSCESDGGHFVSDIVNPVSGDIVYRLHATYALPTDLRNCDVLSLCSFLRSLPSPLEKNFTGLQFLKNDLIDVLECREAMPPAFTDALVEMFRNTSQDQVTRDYAIQHLTTWYERIGKKRPQEAQVIRSTLEAAINETNSVAGTALLGMHRLSKNDSRFNPALVDETAAFFAASPHRDAPTRISSIQVCAERQLKSVIPIVKELSQTSTNVALRISAISALGQLGDREEAKFLNELQQATDKEFRPAIDAALKNLKARTMAY